MHCSYIQPSEHQSPCQINVPEEELIEFNGNLWCKFHLPVSVNGVESEKASWSEEKKKAFVKEANLRKGTYSGSVFPAGYDLVIVPRSNTKYPENYLMINDGETLFAVEFHSKVTINLSTCVFAYTKFFDYVCFNLLGKGHLFHRMFDHVKLFGGAMFNADSEHPLQFSDVRFGLGINHPKYLYNVAIFRGDFRITHFIRSKIFTRFYFQPDNTKVVNNTKNNFSNVDFYNDVYFSDVEKNDVSKIGALFFENVSFHRTARFSSRIFIDELYFIDSIFYSAPDFSNSTLHPITAFIRTKFIDKSENAAEKYRILKTQMANLGDRVAEGKFYALEKKSERGRSRWVEKFFSYTYAAISDYGNSVWMPLGWLFCIYVLFVLGYTAHEAVYMPDTLPTNWGRSISKSLAFSFQQIVAPFVVWRQETLLLTGECGQCSAIKVLASIQSVLSISFITLWLLALRWHFKRN